jgi:hypothetical protein
MKNERFKTVNFLMTGVKTGVRMGVGMKEKFTYGQNICNLNFANGGYIWGEKQRFLIEGS